MKRAGAGKSRLGRSLAYLVSGLALAWVLVLWWDQWPAVVSFAKAAEPLFLAVGLGLAAASALAAFLAYAVLARRLVPATPAIGRLFNFYFISQLLKHLPGRIWGIGYQAAYGRSEAALGTWVGVNLAHMAAASFWALAAAIALLVMLQSPATAGVVLAAAAAAFAGMVLMSAWMDRWRPLSRWPFLRDAVTGPFSRVGAGAWVRIVLVFLFANLLQHGSWLAYGQAFGLPGAGVVLSLSAAYMLAWFIGYVALLTPSGIGIRELSFAWIAGSHDPELVALMAVVGRASYLGVDLLLGSVCLAPRFSARAR